jgi:hypothetical protein
MLCIQLIIDHILYMSGYVIIFYQTFIVFVV